MSEPLYDFRQNYFELFAQPRRFRMDAAHLEQSYREIQARVHPDKSAHLPDAERRASMQWSAHVNEAYRTLKQPLERAIYLLRLNGIEAVTEGTAAMPADFLLRQMEWREAVQHAEAEQDVALLTQIENAIVGEMVPIYAELAASLDETGDMRGAALCARKLKFMEKLKVEIGDALVALDS